MNGQEISTEVRAFLREHISSYEQLEILLLLCGHAEQPWSPEDLATRLDSSASTAADALDHLCRRGLVERHPDGASSWFRYGPRTLALHRAAGELARVYATDRSSVVALMSANAIERMRAEARNIALLLGRRKDL